jgi:hypothetical protein
MGGQTMTDVDALVKSTLETSGIRVARLFYHGNEGTYITFQRISGQDEAYADDEAGAKEYYYRADVFSKTDYTALVTDIEAALKSAGFYGVDDGSETYETDTSFFHMPINFRFMDMEV